MPHYYLLLNHGVRNSKNDYFCCFCCSLRLYRLLTLYLSSNSLQSSKHIAFTLLRYKFDHFKPFPSISQIAGSKTTLELLEYKTALILTSFHCNMFQYFFIQIMFSLIAWLIFFNQTKPKKKILENILLKVTVNFREIVFLWLQFLWLQLIPFCLFKGIADIIGAKYFRLWSRRNKFL